MTILKSSLSALGVCALGVLIVLLTTGCVMAGRYIETVEATYPANGERVTVAGSGVHVLRRGDSGPVVLLIHGASANAREFETNLVPLLQDTHRLIIPDRPGLGHSDRPANANRLETQAKLMAGVLDTLAPGEKAVIVGHSFGGAVALRVAIERPDLVSGLVLLAPVTHDWGGGGVAWYHRFAAPPVFGPVFAQLVPHVGPAQAQAGIVSVFAPEPVPEGYFEASGLPLLFRPASFRANARDLVSLQAELGAQSARYPGLTMPITVYSGEADTVIAPRLHVERLVREAPDVTVLRDPAGGHMPHHSRAREVAATIASLAPTPGTP
jgi:pimeloyl-ACP methyl ester carboxylesterase